MTRLRVRFYDEGPDATATPVGDKLRIRFRPAITSHGNLHEVEGNPPVEDAPLVNRHPFVPRWLRLDHSRNGWSDEFGHPRPEQGNRLPIRPRAQGTAPSPIFTAIPTHPPRPGGRWQNRR